MMTMNDRVTGSCSHYTVRCCFECTLSLVRKLCCKTVPLTSVSCSPRLLMASFSRFAGAPFCAVTHCAGWKPRCAGLCRPGA